MTSTKDKIKQIILFPLQVIGMFAFLFLALDELVKYIYLR